jgi:hypothetical protein
VSQATALNARLLVNRSPQPGGPPGKARSMIDRTSFTFSVSSHRPSALAHANISSSDFAQVWPIRYRDHVVTAFAQLGCYGG